MTSDDLIDRRIIDAARATYEAAYVRVEGNAAVVAAAQAKLAEVMKKREALVAKAGAGDAVTAADLRKAEEATRVAESALAFARDVTAHLVAARDAVHDELSASHGRAAAPLARHGAIELLAAAKRRDEAMALVRDAEAAMDAAASAVVQAIPHGFKVKHAVNATRPGWGMPDRPPARYHTHAETIELLRSAGFQADDLAAA